jgi:fructose-1,6-bisphosphatase/inositol monophosphatase family enzyme
MPPVNTIEDAIKDVAVSAAKAAGHKQVQQFGRTPMVKNAYAHDIKLDMDGYSEEAIVETILGEFSDHEIFTEESGRIGESGEYVWFVDPLDGTMNYHSGLHYFCTCIACYRTNPRVFGSTRTREEDRIREGRPRTQDSLGEPVVGVIYAPILDELFVGVAGHGATLNGRPLQLAPRGGLEEAVVAFSLGSEEKTIQRMEQIVSSLVRRCRKLRLLGACGLDIANIAAGRLDALLQRRVRCWDFAAARIILEEAGGIVDALEIGPDRWDVLACAPRLRDTLLDILADRS